MRCHSFSKRWITRHIQIKTFSSIRRLLHFIAQRFRYIKTERRGRRSLPCHRQIKALALYMINGSAVAYHPSQDGISSRHSLVYFPPLPRFVPNFVFREEQAPPLPHQFCILHSAFCIYAFGVQVLHFAFTPLAYKFCILYLHLWCTSFPFSRLFSNNKMLNAHARS